MPFSPNSAICWVFEQFAWEGQHRSPQARLPVALGSGGQETHAPFWQNSLINEQQTAPHGK
jgi:hypothetical protein